MIAEPDIAADAVAQALAALRLQMEWGADEALDPAPLDRTAQDRASLERAAGPALPGLPGRTAIARPTQPARANIPALDHLGMEELRQAWAAFEGCALRATATHAVLPAGDPAAKLLLVGDAPDGDDDRAGTPFAGEAGRYLDRMLASAGLDRGNMRLAFLVPWRPPGGRPVSETEVQACLPFLHRYLVLAPPGRLVLFGSIAAKAVLRQGDGPRRARGRWRDAELPGLRRLVPALATHPPGQVRTNPRLRREAWADLLLLRSTLDGDVEDRASDMTS